MQAKAKAQRGVTHQPLLPPPYSDENNVYTVDSSLSPRTSPLVHPPLQRKYSPVIGTECCRSDSPHSTSSGDSRNQYSENGVPPLPPTGLKIYFILFKNLLLHSYFSFLYIIVISVKLYPNI